MADYLDLYRMAQPAAQYQIQTENSQQNQEQSIVRNPQDTENPFQQMNDEQFRKRFRLGKEKALFLLDIIKDDIGFSSNRNQPIPVHLRLLISLRFFATGHFQTTDGDLMSVNQSTACRIIHQVSRAIASRRAMFMRFPTPQEQVTEKAAFFSEAGFPSVIGLVDCTHVKIISPGGDSAEIYRNRKGVFSINVQLTCNSRMEFIHIVARWPGSTHDSRIFQASTLPRKVEQSNAVLLGDSGYPLLPYLVTPLPQQPITGPERAYNKAHIATRIKIERTFGVLKRKFHCLQIPLRTKLENTLPIIVAVVCLHNLALTAEDLVIQHIDEDLIRSEQPAMQTLGGQAIRRQIITNYFT